MFLFGKKKKQTGPKTHSFDLLRLPIKKSGVDLHTIRDQKKGRFMSTGHSELAHASNFVVLIRIMVG